MKTIKTIYLILSYLSISFSIYAQNNYSFTLQDSLNFELLKSSYNNDLNKAILLIKQGANVNTGSPEGITPMMYAVQNGNLDMVKLFFYHHADYNYKSKNTESPVVMALMYNDLAMMEFFLQQGVDPNLRNNEYKPLLYLAAENDYYTLTDMLLYYKAKTDLVNVNKWSPLMIATYQGNTETAKLLLESGANPNLEDDNGITALMIAAQKGKDTILSALIAKGGDISIRNKKGNSSLYYAIAHGQTKTTKILLESGALAFEPDQKRIRIIAHINANSEITSLNDKAGIAPMKLYLGEHKISAVTTLHFGDILSGLSYEITEFKYWIGIDMGFLFRPYRKSVLKQVDDNTFYQYREKQYILFLGVNKHFSLERNIKSQSGFYVGLDMMFSWGNYSGTSFSPDNKILPALGGGFFWNYGILSVKTGYQYLNFGYEDFSPHRFTFSLGFRWNNKRL